MNACIFNVNFDYVNGLPLLLESGCDCDCVNACLCYVDFDCVNACFYYVNFDCVNAFFYSVDYDCVHTRILLLFWFIFVFTRLMHAEEGDNHMSIVSFSCLV